MSLETLRRKIDKIDLELLKLLDERMALALKTKEFKPAVHDPEREKTVVLRLKSYASGLSLLSPGFVARLYGAIFEESRNIQAMPRRPAKSRPKEARTTRRASAGPEDPGRKNKEVRS